MSLPIRRILILDDSPEDRETWRRYLSGDVTHQYVFTERDCVEAGLEACRTVDLDCILLDFHLPDGTGVEFIKALRELGGTLRFPLVMLTGTGSEVVAVEAMKAGAQDYLLKNRLNPEALHRTLNAAVYKAHTDRLLARQREELQEAYRQAKEANDRKDQFLAALSHELRTPLTPILAVVSSPGISGSSPEDLEEIFSLIRRNVELEARLIDDLLDITRIAHGKLELNRQLVDVHELIRHALQICRPAAVAKGVRLESVLASTAHLANADPARLQQVFWNLLTNAIKFTPAGGEVRIVTRNPTSGQLEVEVADNGLGIAPAKLDRIFNAFEQAGAQITRQFGGLGLGLAICKALAEAHGGHISVTSPGLGEGARFVVDLGVEAGETVRADGEPAKAAGGRPVAASDLGLTVLLVEDHADSARVLITLMKRKGYRVVRADTVASARELFHNEAIDAIVSDVGLPDGNGLDLIRELRSFRSVPSIVLSGFGETEALANSLEAGALEHLTKPVEWPRLEAALSRVLQRTAS